MTVTYHSKTYASVTGRSDSITIPIPSGVDDTSTLIAVFAGVGFLTADSISGWEGPSGTGVLTMLARRATNSEPSSYTFTWPPLGVPGTEVYYPSGVILNYKGGSRTDGDPRSSYEGTVNTNTSNIPVPTGFVNRTGVTSGDQVVLVAAWSLYWDTYPFGDSPSPSFGHFTPDPSEGWTVRHDDDNDWAVTVADRSDTTDVFFKGHATNALIGSSFTTGVRTYLINGAAGIGVIVFTPGGGWYLGSVTF